jgi:hypothetical protein
VDPENAGLSYDFSCGRCAAKAFHIDLFAVSLKKYWNFRLRSAYSAGFVALVLIAISKLLENRWLAMNSVSNKYFRFALVMLTIALVGCSSASSNDPQWAATNKEVIERSKVTGRTRELPQVSVPALLHDGEPVEASKLPSGDIAPGVKATLWWGRGALVERLEMQPDASYPEQTLDEELIIVGYDGSATVQFDGKTAEMAKDQVIYLQPGAKRSVKAGPKGWKAFEVYSPIRLDHLALVGQSAPARRLRFQIKVSCPLSSPASLSL